MKRTPAEWASLCVSVAIVLGVVGLVIYEHFHRWQHPPVIEVTVRADEARRNGETFYVPLRVENTGGKAAQDVEVEVSLEGSRTEPERATLMVDFLAGGASRRGSVAFEHDPARGRLSARVLRYLEP